VYLRAGLVSIKKLKTKLVEMKVFLCMKKSKNNFRKYAAQEEVSL